MRIPFAAASLFLLAACEGEIEQIAAAPAPAGFDYAEADVMGARGRSDGKAAPSAPLQDDGDPGVGALLAYSYSAQLVLPSDAVKTVMDAHVAACAAAGLARCQLLSSNFNDADADQVYGSVFLRAEPVWLATFRDGLEDEAAGAGGRVRSEGVDVEDLTTQIVDVEARLAAKRTLRDRLQNLLSQQSGDVGDLLEVERELANVIADLDAAESHLAQMRRRVDMSTMSLAYYSRASVESGSVLAPLGQAFGDFADILVMAVAFIVRAVAFLIPFAILAAPLAWWLRRALRRRRARKAKAA